jgi:hypothetical protein
MMMHAGIETLIQIKKSTFPPSSPGVIGARASPRPE